MYIRIYQVNLARDYDRTAFMGYDYLERKNGGVVDASIYDIVFSGEVECGSLEEVYRKFSLDMPDGYEGRSLSVSDIVEAQVEPEDIRTCGFYYCDVVGFKRVDFDHTKCKKVGEDEAELTVVLVEPLKHPRVVKVGSELKALQKVVGGMIEEYMPFDDDVAIICNEEGAVNGMEPNRAVYCKDGTIENIIFGTFFLVYAPFEAERFKSLPKPLQEKYMKLFETPERFVSVNGNITVIPVK